MQITELTDSDLTASLGSRDEFRMTGLISAHDRSVINAIKPNLETGPWIAGGAAMAWFRGEQLHGAMVDYPTLTDIDVYFASQDQLHATQQAMSNFNESQATKYQTKNAETFLFFQNTAYCWKIQFITRQFYSSVDSVLAAFDFTCCGVATDGASFKLLPGAAQDLNAKVLNINKFNPDSALQRTLKYWSYGYTPSPALIELLSTDSQLRTNFTGHTEYDGI